MSQVPTTSGVTAAAPSYADNPNLFPLPGGCACGNIRYRLLKPPLVVHCCHCTHCQRETGCAFAINALVEPEFVEVREPEPEPVQAAAEETATDSQEDNRDSSSSSSSGKVIAVPVPAASGSPQIIHRCPRCLTALWSCYGPNAHRDAIRFLRVGTLDCASDIEPDVHIYVASKRAFVALEDEKPQFEEFYPSPAAVYRPEALERLQVLVQKMMGEGEGERK